MNNLRFKKLFELFFSNNSQIVNCSKQISNSSHFVSCSNFFFESNMFEMLKMSKSSLCWMFERKFRTKPCSIHLFKFSFRTSHEAWVIRKKFRTFHTLWVVRIFFFELSNMVLFVRKCEFDTFNRDFKKTFNKINGFTEASWCQNTTTLSDIN